VGESNQSGLQAGLEPELREYLGHVSLDRALGDSEQRGDLTVGVAMAQQGEDLELTLGEQVHLAQPFPPGELGFVVNSMVARISGVTRITGVAADVWQSMAPV
jgi:hypothetical protein